MSNRTFSNIIIRVIFSLALIMAIWAPGQSQSGKNAQKRMMDDKMMERCQVMMDQKQKMMTEMKAQDADLTAEVAKMNNAPDKKKLKLLAAIVTHMVENRTFMNAKIEKMQEGMMMHMMQHMQMGQDSMSNCPMMMSLKNMDDKTAYEHKEHQESMK